ncbi:MAG TPA: hypothetical protein VGM80_18020 [Gaiellaceae bacterium]
MAVADSHQEYIDLLRRSGGKDFAQIVMRVMADRLRRESARG